MSWNKRIFEAAAAICAFAAAASSARAEDPALITFSGGYFDVVRQEETAVEAHVQYRGGERIDIFRPFAGLAVTSDGATNIFAGLLIDIYLGDRVVLTPSLSPSLYLEGGGKDLGFPLIWRPQIELAYRFDDGSRLGVSFLHLSNAGASTSNPSSESVLLTYSIPADRIFGLFD
ncbi:MAG: acyloxyacyl hydrolase [Minwuiales bacterium]|nr:acyloxyacyl hydrolase [Minwuiales bacterium]